MNNAEYNYPDVLKMSAAELRARGWFVDSTSDDIDFSDYTPPEPFDYRHCAARVQ